MQAFVSNSLCPVDCCLPGSSVHGIFQARTLERVAICSSQGIFPTQALKPCLLCLLNWQAGSLPWHHLGSLYIHAHQLADYPFSPLDL